MDIAEERLLWDMALQHLGHDELLELAVDLWRSASAPPTRLVEHLSTGNMSQPVLNILKIAQERVGAFVPGQAPAPGIVTSYARHASDLADGLITRMP